MTLQRKNQGFTIVELLIVIVVIGILAALVITTFAGIQQRARNTERETDIKAIHGHLEAFYAQRGYYPPLVDINDTEWRAENMVGLDADALQPPNSTQTTLNNTPSADQYGYIVVPATCTAEDEQCTGYTLEAVMEDSDDNYTKGALN